MEKRMCIVCGQEYEVHHPVQMFCSLECKSKGRRITQPDAEGFWVRTCRICGKEFKVPMSKNANGTKYCGPECKKEAQRMRSAEAREREKIRNRKICKDLEKAVKKAKGKNYGEFYAPEVKVIFPSWVVPTRRGVKNG